MRKWTAVDLPDLTGRTVVVTAHPGGSAWSPPVSSTRPGPASSSPFVP